MTRQVKLGVNIDHVATLRNARGEVHPSVLKAALLVEQAGGDGITVHLREDRRHIKDADVFEIKEKVNKHIEEFFNFLEEKEEPEVYSIENWTFTTIPDQFIELKVLKINASCFTQVAQQVVKVNAVEAVHSYLPHKTIIIPAEDIIEAQNSVICRHKYVPQLLQVFPKLLKAQVLNQCE